MRASMRSPPPACTWISPTGTSTWRRRAASTGKVLDSSPTTTLRSASAGAARGASRSSAAGSEEVRWRGWGCRIGCPPVGRVVQVGASAEAVVRRHHPLRGGSGRVSHRCDAVVSAAMPSNSPFAAQWTIDPSVDFLNHGCYGCCPRVVLGAEAELRALRERQPLDFLSRRLPGLFDDARESLAEFVGADAAGMVAVPNATTGVRTGLRALEGELGPGDELLTTDHAYNACKNAVDWLATRRGAKVVVARVPFPVRDAGEVVAVVLGGSSERTRVGG